MTKVIEQRILPSNPFNEKNKGSAVRLNNQTVALGKFTRIGLTRHSNSVSINLNNALALLVVFTAFILLLYLIFVNKYHGEC